MRALASLALLVLAAAPPASALATTIIHVGGDEGDVSIQAYDPPNVTIEAGDRVEWTNVGGATPHTVTGAHFDSSPEAPRILALLDGDGGVVGRGARATFAHAFDEPGTFEVRCKLHANMTQTIVVTRGAAGPDVAATMGTLDGDRSTLRFEPPVLRITTGTRVVWSNPGEGDVHTVTGWENGTLAFDSSPALTNDTLARAGELERGTGGFLLPTQTYVEVLPDPGVYAYACQLHPAMRGTVTVLAASASARRVPAAPLALVGLALYAGALVRAKVRSEK